MEIVTRLGWTNCPSRLTTQKGLPVEIESHCGVKRDVPYDFRPP
jgi:hypothetical protein